MMRVPFFFELSGSERDILIDAVFVVLLLQEVHGRKSIQDKALCSRCYSSGRISIALPAALQFPHNYH